MYFVKENLILPKTEKSPKQDNKKTDKDYIFKEGEQGKNKQVKLTVDTDHLVFALESDVYDAKKVDNVISMLRNKVKISDKKEIQRIFSEYVKNFSIKEFKKFISEMCFYPMSEHMPKEVFFEITKVIAEHVYINYMEYNNFFASEELVFGIHAEWFVEFMKTNLNFQDKKKTVQTYMYLRLVNIVDRYADLEQVMLLEEWKEKTKPLFDYIREQKDNPEISYFLHLYANDVYSEHANMRTETWFEQFNKELDEYEAKMNEKYGNSWGKLEERIEELQENIVESRQEPFLIAPKIYAIPGYNGFYISQEKDFEVIQKLISDLKKLPHSFNDFLSIYDREGSYGLDLRRYDEFYSEGEDDEEYIRQEIYDLFYYKMIQLLKYFTKSLNINDISANKNIEESVFNEYIILQVSDIKKIIQNEFKFNFSDLHLREQLYFVKFAKETTLADADKIKKFVKVATDKDVRINRIKAFLSLEQGGEEMGEKILLIGERLGVEEADLIFGQYAKIVDMTENVREELKKILKRQKIDVEEIDEQVFKNITESVLLKAGELLVNFADRLERGEALDSKKILEELKSFNENLLFTFGTFKNFKGQLRLEDLEDTEFERVSVERYSDLKEEIIAIRNENYTLEEIEKIADEDKRLRLKEVYEMFELYRKNYKDREKFLEILLDSFVKVLTENKTDTHLYFVKQHGIIIGFNRYDIVGEDKKIMGSCNVMPSVQALSVGGAMFVESLDNEKEGYDLELATDAFSPVSLMYMKRGKFQVEKITNEFDPNGKWSFVMRRIKDGERNSFYEGKDLVKEYKKQNTENNQQEVANRFVVRLPKDSVQNNEYIRELVNERGFKITNMLEREGMMYLGMEKG